MKQGPVTSAARLSQERIAPGRNSRLGHIVVLMLENRSFDQMLGTVPGVDGVLDASGAIKEACFNLADPGDPRSKRYPVQLGAPLSVSAVERSTRTPRYGGPSHSFPAATQQLYGQADISGAVLQTIPPHNAGFVASWINNLHGTKVGKRPTVAEVAQVMAVFTQSQLPVLSKLATEFCVCDRWFSEVPGPTEPNRLFTHAGTSTGLTCNPWRYDIVNTPTVFDRLTDAGVPWKIYYQDLSDASNFKSLRESKNNVPLAHFYADAEAGTLPAYSFLCPRYADTPDDKANSQHAPEDVRYGELFIADVYEALRMSRCWEDTMLIVTYDEHGGYYDHVLPPQGVPNPDGLYSPNAFMKKEGAVGDWAYLLKPDYQFDFTRLGCRVPAVLISPWIAAGTVVSTQLQHTSILATLRDLYGFEPLTRRDAAAHGFGDVVQALDAPRTDCPVGLQRPAIPAPLASAMATAPSATQVEVANRYTANLSGHSDQGASQPRNFGTRGELAQYVLQRQLRHVEAEAVRRSGAYYEIVRRGIDGYQWSLRSAPGETLATSAETYKTEGAAHAAIARVRDVASDARLLKPQAPR